MILPQISVYYDNELNKFIDDSAEPAAATEDKKVIRIQLLTNFIDLFNYYPLKVNKLRYKNDSNELTYVMNSNTQGTKNERGESLIGKEKPKI